MELVLPGREKPLLTSARSGVAAACQPHGRRATILGGDRDWEDASASQAPSHETMEVRKPGVKPLFPTGDQLNVHGGNAYRGPEDTHEPSSAD